MVKGSGALVKSASIMNILAAKFARRVAKSFAMFGVSGFESFQKTTTCGLNRRQSTYRNMRSKRFMLCMPLQVSSNLLELKRKRF